MKGILTLKKTFLYLIFFLSFGFTGCNKNPREKLELKNIATPHFALNVWDRENEGYPFTAILITSEKWTNQEYASVYGEYKGFDQYIVDENVLSKIVSDVEKKFRGIVLPESEGQYSEASDFRITILRPGANGRVDNRQELPHLNGKYLLNFLDVLEEDVQVGRYPELTKKLEALRKGVKNNSHPVL